MRISDSPQRRRVRRVRREERFYHEGHEAHEGRVVHHGDAEDAEGDFTTKDTKFTKERRVKFWNLNSGLGFIRLCARGGSIFVIGFSI